MRIMKKIKKMVANHEPSENCKSILKTYGIDWKAVISIE